MGGCRALSGQQALCFPYLISLGKTLAQCRGQAARQSWLDPGCRFPEGDSRKGTAEMYLREQVVPFVTAGATLSRVFSLGLVC